MEPGSRRYIEHPHGVSDRSGVLAERMNEDEVARHAQIDNLSMTQRSRANISGLVQRVTAAILSLFPAQAMRSHQERTANHVENVIARLCEQITRRDDAIKSSELLIAQLREELAVLQAYNATCQTELEASIHYEAQLQETQRELLSCNAKIKRLENEVDMRDAIVRKVQESAFAQVDPAEWKPEEDSVIISAFQDLDKRIQRWAKTFALKSLSSRPTFTEATRDFVKMDSNGRWPQALYHNKLAEKLCAMLAQAWVSNHIYHRIIADPFFFMGTLYAPENANNCARDQDNCAQFLEQLMFDITQGSMEKAVPWRSDVLRMLMPSTDKTSPHSLSKLRTKTECAVAKSCAASARMLFQQGIRSILHPEGLHDAMKELGSIFKTAGDLSYKLWARKDDFFVAGLSCRDLKVYHAGSTLLDNHALHNNELESDPNALDGSPVVLMLSPIVVVRGLSGSHRNNSQRIWKKGIAFMGLPGDNTNH